MTAYIRSYIIYLPLFIHLFIMNRFDIVNDLKDCQDKIDAIVDGLENDNRLKAVLAMFDLVELISKVEPDLYNYFRRK